MSKRHINPAYAKLDPAHLFDGLFVPTRGKKRDRLLVEPRKFGDLEIGFQGFEQLGADDQSILLALSAQLGIDGLVIDENPRGPISKQLRVAIDFENDDGSEIVSKRTSLRSLLIDSGYKDPDSGRALKMAKDCLNRLASAQIREINLTTGWDRRCNLISVSFNHKTGEIYVAANPRLTGAVFSGQHIKVSLFEHNVLESEPAQLLHTWLCSNIRLGKSLGNGNGAHIDTLAPHVWGQVGWESFSKQSKSQKRGHLRNALDEIFDQTKSLHGGYGWSIDQTSNGIVLISRPKELPFVEGKLEMSPSQFHEVMTYESEPTSEDINAWTTN